MTPDEAVDWGVVAFDLETTDADPETAHIVEFSFVRLDPDRLTPAEVWTERVDPHRPIHPDAWEVHGISEEDVETEPSFEHYAGTVQDIVHDALLVAYHAEFDLRVLDNELTRYGKPGLPDQPGVVDPLRIFKAQLTRSLEDAADYYLDGYPGEPHGAEDDAMAAAMVFQTQVNHHAGPPYDLDEALHPDGRTPVDLDGKFYEDEDGVVRFAFGKHESEPAAEHPDYLNWMLGRDFSESTKQVAEDQLAEGPP